MGAGLASALRRSIFRSSVGPINFASKDGANAAFEAGFVKLDRPMQIAVIGHRDRRHPQLDNPRDQFLDPTEPVQQRVFGVEMKVGKCHEAREPPPRSLPCQRHRLGAYPTGVVAFTGRAKSSAVSVTGAASFCRRTSSIIRICFNNPSRSLRRASGGISEKSTDVTPR